MVRLLLADRVKSRENSFLNPLMPALARHYETRFIAAGPGEELAGAIAPATSSGWNGAGTTLPGATGLLGCTRRIVGPFQ